MMEALVVLASMLQEVRFLTVPGEAFPVADPRITLRPASCTLLLERHPRSKAASREQVMGTTVKIEATYEPRRPSSPSVVKAY